MLQQSLLLVDDHSMSNLTSVISNEASLSSSNNINEMGTSTGATNMYPQQQNQYFAAPSNNNQAQPNSSKRKRNLPGNPDPEAEVVALSPRALMATNRFLCEVCNKGFQRDQNLQLHRRGHNLPWKLKQRNKNEILKKKVFICPEPSCVHHDPSRALGDLTGIKKHFSRKHGEKKWKCEKCSKRYAVQSDWKAHSKICGTREYRCDCGTLFSRRDSFITHRAFCDALAEESSRSMTHLQNPLFMNISSSSQTAPTNNNFIQAHLNNPLLIPTPKREAQNFNNNNNNLPPWLSSSDHHTGPPQMFSQLQENHQNPNNNNNSALMSATALLQKAAQMGVTISTNKLPFHHVGAPGFGASYSSATVTAGMPTSREENNMGTGFLHGLASFGGDEKVVNVTNNGCMELQDMNNIMGNSSSNSNSTTCHGFDGSIPAFDNSFGNAGLFNTRNINGHLMMSARKEGGQDGLTRDFLGLRAFPDHRDFINMAALDQMGSSSYDQHSTQNQAPWRN